MKTGIFGGTFNPVHNGHVAALKAFREFSELDRVFVFVTGTPPHKQLLREVSDEDRAAMAGLAFPDAITDDFEIRSGGKSYTVNTVEYLKRKFPEDELFLYMGSDMILCIETVWHRFEEILANASVTVLSRFGDDVSALEKHAAYLNEKYGADVRVAKADTVVISSTEIRKRIKNRESISGLVPEAVEKYIFEKGLYR